MPGQFAPEWGGQFDAESMVTFRRNQVVNISGISTYGTSIDIIMENIFKRNNTIGDKSRDEIDVIQEQIKNKRGLTKKQVQDFKQKTEHLGDSMEKILLFAKLNQLEK